VTGNFRSAGTNAERWPALLKNVLADVEQTIKEDGSAGLRNEGEKILKDVKTLKEDMELDRPLR
jgi:hypothetical protein